MVGVKRCAWDSFLNPTLTCSRRNSDQTCPLLSAWEYKWPPPLIFFSGRFCRITVLMSALMSKCTGFYPQAIRLWVCSSEPSKHAYKKFMSSTFRGSSITKLVSLFARMLCFSRTVSESEQPDKWTQTRWGKSLKQFSKLHCHAFL